jgi:hypothetical protein
VAAVYMEAPLDEAMRSRLYESRRSPLSALDPLCSLPAIDELSGVNTRCRADSEHSEPLCSGLPGN